MKKIEALRQPFQLDEARQALGIGLHVDLSAFGQLSTAILAIIALAAAAVSRLIGCGLGARLDKT